VHTFYIKKIKNYAGQIIPTCFNTISVLFYDILYLMLLLQWQSRLSGALHFFTYTMICCYALGNGAASCAVKKVLIHAGTMKSHVWWP